MINRHSLPAAALAKGGVGRRRNPPALPPSPWETRLLLHPRRCQRWSRISSPPTAHLKDEPCLESNADWQRFTLTFFFTKTETKNLFKHSLLSSSVFYEAIQSLSIHLLSDIRAASAHLSVSRKRAKKNKDQLFAESQRENLFCSRFCKQILHSGAS